MHRQLLNRARDGSRQAQQRLPRLRLGLVVAVLRDLLYQLFELIELLAPEPRRGGRDFSVLLRDSRAEFLRAAALGRELVLLAERILLLIEVIVSRDILFVGG